MNDLVFFSFDLLYLTHFIHSFVVIVVIDVVVVASSLNGVGQQKPKPNQKNTQCCYYRPLVFPVAFFRPF